MEHVWTSSVHNEHNCEQPYSRKTPMWVFRKGAEITKTLAAGGTGMFSCCMVQASIHK